MPVVNYFVVLSSLNSFAEFVFCPKKYTNKIDVRMNWIAQYIFKFFETKIIFKIQNNYIKKSKEWGS